MDLHILTNSWFGGGVSISHKKIKDQRRTYTWIKGQFFCTQRLTDGERVAFSKILRETMLNT